MSNFTDATAHIKRDKDGVHIDMEFPNLVVRMTKEEAHVMGVTLLGMSMPQEEVK